jgi:hypothetical protein
MTLTVIIMKNVLALLLDRESPTPGMGLHLFELGGFALIREWVP